MTFEIGDRVRVTPISLSVELIGKTGTVTYVTRDKNGVIVEMDIDLNQYSFGKNSLSSLEKIEKVYPVGEEWPRKVQSTDGMIYNPITDKWFWF